MLRPQQVCIEFYLSHSHPHFLLGKVSYRLPDEMFHAKLATHCGATLVPQRH